MWALRPLKVLIAVIAVVLASGDISGGSSRRALRDRSSKKNKGTKGATGGEIEVLSPEDKRERKERK